MTILEELKNLKVAMGGEQSNAETILEALNEIAEDCGGQPNGETIAEAIKNIAENYTPTPAVLDVKVKAYNGTADLFGKVASDLQENIALTATEVTGTLKFVEDYTGFSSIVEEQSGNYLVLHAESVDGAVITAEVVGGTHGPVTLDSDGIIVFRIANNTQSVRFVATKGNETATETYALTNLVLEEQAIIQDDTELTINALENETITQNGNTLIIGGNE